MVFYLRDKQLSFTTLRYYPIIRSSLFVRDHEKISVISNSYIHKNKIRAMVYSTFRFMVDKESKSNPSLYDNMCTVRVLFVDTTYK